MSTHDEAYYQIGGGFLNPAPDHLRDMDHRAAAQALADETGEDVVVWRRSSSSIGAVPYSPWFRCLPSRTREGERS